MNREIELHDTRVERIEQADGNIVLWLSAYMHESDGRPGWDRGTGWKLPARLVIENGELDNPFSSSSLWITDGHIAAGNRFFENAIPLPFDEHGDIRLLLTGAEGQLAVHGNHVYLEETGPAVYVEEFHPSKER
ncbi:MAG: hypothetical protein ACLP9L_29700 [Thermoguttaceae bacterium]